MMRLWFLFILIIPLNVTIAQSKNAKLIDWKMLSEVKFEDKYSEELAGWYLYPVFSEKVKMLANKKVVIKGYIIPVDVEGGEYALSAYPFSSCFFCGGAGPESVMTLKFAEKPKRYKTDDVVTFMGTLQLNDSDIDSFCYILKSAEPLD